MGPRWRLVLIALAYILYLFLGATIFSAIEHPIEGEMIKDLQSKKTKFLDDHKCVKGKFCKLSLCVKLNKTETDSKVIGSNSIYPPLRLITK